MKKIFVASILLALTATFAFAHAGEVHTWLGTITQLNPDGSFVMKLTSGTEKAVLTSKSTAYWHADGQKGKLSELAVGRRVSAKISKDGKTALSVKLSAARSKPAK